MRKKYLLLTLLTVWTAFILYGCGRKTDSDIPVSPTTSTFQDALEYRDTEVFRETSVSRESTASREILTSQATSTPIFTPQPTASSTPEPETERQTDLHPFSDVLGYEEYYITVDENMPPHFNFWRFYAWIDSETQCVAETSGYDDLPNAYSTDLDGDGVNEFIANCTYGDGGERVYIYRVHNGIIQQEYIDIDGQTLETKYSMDTMGMATSIAEIYDPQENVFIVTGPSLYDEETIITITFSFDDREYFTFGTYNP